MREITEKTKSGKEYTFYRTKNDWNGNPRYVVSWLTLGLPDYKHNKETRKAGLSIYRGKDFGGGFVFQSYNTREMAEYFERHGLCVKE